MAKLSKGTNLGAYRIVRLIGRGGMGEVYEAFEDRLQRRVALKVIAPQRADEYGEIDLVRRFLQEARTLAQVNHPNVVTIYAIDRYGDIEFIAMEFVAGALLKDMFALFTLSADEAAPMFLGMLEGLRALHENRILHRDLKPHNLMLRANGQIKILDFGIAKRLGDKNHENTTAGVVVGTLSYLPPEVLYGTPANERSDLWSLGAIFYECMVGQPLVNAHSVKVKGIRAVDSDVVFPQESLGWIPPQMRDIVAKLCDRRPEARYQNASEAIDDIRKFQMSRPPVPSSFAKALAKNIENIHDIKRRVTDERVSSPKAKRALWQALVGERMGEIGEAESYQPQPDPNESGITQVIRDSVSSRNRAKSDARWTKWMKSLNNVTVPAVIVIVMGSSWSFFAKRAASRLSNKTAMVENGVQTAKLLAPADGQNLWLDNNQKVDFSWTQLVNPDAYILQVARDQEFNAMVIDEPLTAVSYHTNRNFAEGDYFWRLTPVHNTTLPVVGPAHFSISLISAVELKSPPNGKRFTVDEAINSGLTWACKPHVQHYRAQIAYDAGFTHLADERVLSDCSWPEIHLAGGSYYWRVQIEEPQFASPTWSQVRSFRINQVGVAPTAAHSTPVAHPSTPLQALAHTRHPVELMDPHVENAKVSVTLNFRDGGKERSLASIQKAVENPPQLTWSMVHGARNYHLQLSTRPDFSQVLVTTTVEGPRFVWHNPVPGHFFWRIRAQGEGGARSAFSESGQLDVSLPAPNLSSDFSISDEGVLEWKAVPLAAKYIVQWSKSRTMASVSESQVGEPRFPLKLSESPFFVRVAAAERSGARVSEFSQPATVELEAPTVHLKTPKEGVHVRVGSSGKISVIFSWAKLEGASGYELQVAADPEFAKVIEQKSLNGHIYVLKEAKLKGLIYWRVRAVGANGPQNWSSVSTFSVL